MGHEIQPIAPMHRQNRIETEINYIYCGIWYKNKGDQLTIEQFRGKIKVKSSPFLFLSKSLPAGSKA